MANKLNRTEEMRPSNLRIESVPFDSKVQWELAYLFVVHSIPLPRFGALEVRKVDDLEFVYEGIGAEHDPLDLVFVWRTS